MVVSKRFIVLLISAVALLVGLATMVGGTYATDTLTYTKDNGLKFNLISLNGNTETILEENASISLFSSNWEPGRMEIARLKVENKGNLPFNFWIYPKETEETEATKATEVTGNTADLASVIDVYIYRGNYYNNGENNEIQRPNLSNGEWEKLGTLREITDASKTWKSPSSPGKNEQKHHGSVGAFSSSDSSANVTLLLHMRESAGNEYEKATAEISLTVYAKNLTGNANQNTGSTT